MAVGVASTDFLPVPGVRLASLAAGIKPGGAPDLALMEFAEGSAATGVFTQSHFAAPPVELAKQHLASQASRYFLINSGNANAATGAQGLADARACCAALSQLTGARPEAVLPFSTGVIGEALPVAQITEALPQALAALAEDQWLEAAKAIMTTDTRPKIASRAFRAGGKPVTLTGMAKGAGMIQPRMATLLAYLATDIRASQAELAQALASAVDQSFNRITIDGDESTNDACMLTATGLSGVAYADARPAFDEALASLALELAQGIVRDAEGATKFVEVQVKGGKSSAACLSVAYAIANSPLVKTALHASDPNWGRLAMAIGKADAPLEASKVDIHIGGVCLMKSGARHPAYTEAQGAQALSGDEIQITVNLNQGPACESIWTSDLSHAYITINTAYRT